MTAHTIKAVQKIPASKEQVWNFFSSAANLRSITPASMNFRVTSQYHGGTLYAGQIFEYKVSPVLDIPLYWMTEVTHVKEMDFFADDQRYGPYKMWQHQHHFKTIPGGTEMTDIIHYKNPLWILGNLANALFVKRKLREIFEYRFVKVQELFGKWEGGQSSQIIIG